jgi:rubredoxin
METWECTICGYIYDPAENNGVAFEDLPSDWICPECGAALDMFSVVA